MKNLLFLLLCINVSTFYAQNNTSKFFSQTFNTIDCEEVIIYIDTTNTNIQVHRTHNNYITVKTEVLLGTHNPNILNILYLQGRYHTDLIINQNSRTGVLTLKNEKAPFQINRNTIEENITYSIYLPENLEYKIQVPAKRKEIEQLVTFRFN